LWWRRPEEEVLAACEELPGTTKLHRMEENIAAADVTLSDDELAQLANASSKIEIQGGRYPDFLEAQTNL
jgi:diketogulonate reductase-like aldo/keto reductase